VVSVNVYEITSDEMLEAYIKTAELSPTNPNMFGEDESGKASMFSKVNGDRVIFGGIIEAYRISEMIDSVKSNDLIPFNIIYNTFDSIFGFFKNEDH
jgi:hypothetical protein